MINLYSRLVIVRQLTLYALFTMAICGCANTERELIQSQIDLYAKAIKFSQDTLKEIQNNHGPGQYQFKAYVAFATINDALKSLDNFSIKLDSIDAVAVLKNLRLEQYGSFPSVTFEAQAVRDQFTIEVQCTAVLMPTKIPGEFQLSVLSFVPNVSWFQFELTKSKFISDLLSIEVSKLSMPVIQLPVQGHIALGGAGYTTDVTFRATPHPSDITMRVTIPGTEWNPSMRNVRYYFLNDGVFVFGDLQ